MTRTAQIGTWGVIALIGTSTLIFAAYSRSQSQRSHRYLVDENSNSAIGLDKDSAGAGPVRLGRVSMKHGAVAWRPAHSGNWADAPVNMPVRQGAEFWVKPGSRGEVQFDDGSTLRMGGDAVASLQTMYSDRRGEYTQIKLNRGLASLDLRNRESVYQVDTPYDSVRAYGPADCRIGVGQGSEVCVRSGQAEVDGPQGDTTLYPGQLLAVNDVAAPYEVVQAPPPDDWDRFDNERNAQVCDYDPHLPSDVALVAGDLRQYGDWRDDPSYGQVWCPRVSEAAWQPYRDGHWAWVSPFGWTWVDDQPWAYAPSHYGTWVHQNYGWAWCPGPAQQYWSPAVVQFSQCNDQVAWCPLAPREVRYPALSVAFGSGDWCLNFSIGGVACYAPTNLGYCSPCNWDNRYVNQVTNITNITNITNVYNLAGNQWGQCNYIPRNAVYGSCVASRDSFVNAGGCNRLSGADEFFRRGRSLRGDRGIRDAFLSGPQVLPTSYALAGGRQIVGNVARVDQLLQRRAYSAALPVGVQSHVLQVARNERSLPLHYTSTTASPAHVAAPTALLARGAVATRTQPLVHNNALPQHLVSAQPTGLVAKHSVPAHANTSALRTTPLLARQSSLKPTAAVRPQMLSHVAVAQPAHVLSRAVVQPAARRALVAQKPAFKAPLRTMPSVAAKQSFAHPAPTAIARRETTSRPAFDSRKLVATRYQPHTWSNAAASELRSSYHRPASEAPRSHSYRTAPAHEFSTPKSSWQAPARMQPQYRSSYSERPSYRSQAPARVEPQYRSSYSERPSYRSQAARVEPQYRPSYTDRPSYRSQAARVEPQYRPSYTERPSYRTPPARVEPQYRPSYSERPSYRTAPRVEPQYRPSYTDRTSYRTAPRVEPQYRPSYTERPSYRTAPAGVEPQYRPSYHSQPSWQAPVRAEPHYTPPFHEPIRTYSAPARQAPAPAERRDNRRRGDDPYHR